MARPRQAHSEVPSTPPAVEVLVRITEQTFHDEKDTGFAVLFDPEVVTERVLGSLRKRFWDEQQRAFRGRDMLNPFTGEILPALHNEPAPEKPWMLAVARRVTEPFVRRGAMALLEVCGDESRDVEFRLTTGELTKAERRGSRELETHRLVLTATRLAAGTGMLLPRSAEELAQDYSEPSMYEVSLSPGTYRVAVSGYDASSRATHAVVVQLLPSVAP